MQTIYVSGPSVLTNGPVPNFGDDRARIYLPREWRPNNTTRAVMICLGSGDGFQLSATPVVLGLANALTDAGYAAAISTYGGTLFANATQRARVDALRTYLNTATIGARPKVAMVGFSMGGQVALSYAGNNPSQVSSVLGVCPLVDMATVASDPTVTAAYPGGWTEAANGATTNPKTMATAGKYANIDVRVGYTTGDQVIPQATVTDFATRVGKTAENLGSTTHTASNLSLSTTITSVLAQLAATN